MTMQVATGEADDKTAAGYFRSCMQAVPVKTLSTNQMQ